MYKFQKGRSYNINITGKSVAIGCTTNIPLLLLNNIFVIELTELYEFNLPKPGNNSVILITIGSVIR